MGQPLVLHATLEKRGPAGAFLLTDEQAAALGEGRKAFPVRVTLHGTALSLRLARMGGENMIGLSKASRAQAGVEIGGTYDVEIELDEGEREVEVPDELQQALDGDSAARDAYAKLSFTHRKEFARWVAEAKTTPTRERRVATTLEMLREGRTR